MVVLAAGSSLYASQNLTAQQALKYKQLLMRYRAYTPGRMQRMESLAQTVVNASGTDLSVKDRINLWRHLVLLGIGKTEEFERFNAAMMALFEKGLGTQECYWGSYITGHYIGYAQPAGSYDQTFKVPMRIIPGLTYLELGCGEAEETMESATIHGDSKFICLDANPFNIRNAILRAESKRYPGIKVSINIFGPPYLSIGEFEAHLLSHDPDLPVLTNLEFRCEDASSKISIADNSISGVFIINVFAYQSESLIRKTLRNMFKKIKPPSQINLVHAPGSEGPRGQRYPIDQLLTFFQEEAARQGLTLIIQHKDQRETSFLVAA